VSKKNRGEIEVMPYDELLSSDKPGYVVILIDQSASMSSSWGGSTKAKECAKAVNLVLAEIGASCTDDDKIKNRVYISVLGYGNLEGSVSNALSGSLASKEIVSIRELVSNYLRIEKTKVKMSDGAGAEVEIDEEFPVWIEPIAEDGTPMTEAFIKAYKLVEAWIQAHQSSFPPVVINITDGQPNDESTARSVALDLVKLGTENGNTLMLNGHISDSSTNRINFPSSHNELPPGDSYAKFLFDISSKLPPMMLKRAKAKGYQPREGARGFVYNANVQFMIDLLEIGSFPQKKKTKI
jgi:uncharacterized protein YegL